jgi:hypothetical protein
MLVLVAEEAAVPDIGIVRERDEVASLLGLTARPAAVAVELIAA